MGESKIIVVANQKGGVGKSTVCMTLANYLALELKFRVGGIIDTDFQKSVLNRRKSDIERNEGTSNTPSYEVTSFELDNYANIPDLVDVLRKTGMIYIFDTPGLINHQGIVVLLALADYIIVPFSYDALTITSTSKFIIFWNNLKDMMSANGGEPKGKIFFVPMIVDNRVGTVAERILWNDLKETYSKVGVITPQIGYYPAKMERCDTISLTPAQTKVVQDAYQFIVDNIYNPETNTESDEQYPES